MAQFKGPVFFLFLVIFVACHFKVQGRMFEDIDINENDHKQVPQKCPLAHPQVELKNDVNQIEDKVIHFRKNYMEYPQQPQMQYPMQPPMQHPYPYQPYPMQPQPQPYAPPQQPQPQQVPKPRPQKRTFGDRIIDSIMDAPMNLIDKGVPFFEKFLSALNNRSGRKSALPDLENDQMVIDAIKQFVTAVAKYDFKFNFDDVDINNFDPNTTIVCKTVKD